MSESSGILLVLGIIFFFLIIPALLKTVSFRREKLIIGGLSFILCLGAGAGCLLYNENQSMKASIGTDYMVTVRETQSMLEESNIRKSMSPFNRGRYTEELTQHMTELQKAGMDTSYHDGWEQLEEELRQLSDAENEADAEQHKKAAAALASDIRERLSDLEEDIGNEGVRWYEAINE
ncbi:hypothetical protein [Salibacterium sp. K-3]